LVLSPAPLSPLLALRAENTFRFVSSVIAILSSLGFLFLFYPPHIKRSRYQTNQRPILPSIPGPFIRRNCMSRRKTIRYNVLLRPRPLDRCGRRFILWELDCLNLHPTITSSLSHKTQNIPNSPTGSSFFPKVWCVSYPDRQIPPRHSVSSSSTQSAPNKKPFPLATIT